MFNDFLIALVKTLILLVDAVFGAWFIKNAVDCFKYKRYYAFGLNVMGAVMEAARIFKHVFYM